MIIFFFALLSEYLVRMFTKVLHIFFMVVLVCKRPAHFMTLPPDSTLKTVRFTSLIIYKTRTGRPRIMMYMSKKRVSFLGTDI
jgi:hypothetical protein